MHACILARHKQGEEFNLKNADNDDNSEDL